MVPGAPVVAERVAWFLAEDVGQCVKILARPSACEIPMHVVRHPDPDAFIAAAAPMAARGEASASPFAGWAHSMKRAPPAVDERVYLATYGDCGAAIQRDDGPLFMGQSDPAAAAAFADDLVARLAGAAGRGRHARRLRGIRATLEGEHGPGAFAARALAAALAFRCRRRPRGAGRAARRGRKPTCRGSSTDKSRSSSRPGFPIRPSAFGPGCRSASRAATIGSGMIALRRRSPDSMMPRPTLRASRRSTPLPSIAAAATRPRWWRRFHASCLHAASAASSSRPTSPIRRRTRSTRGSASSPKPTSTTSI